MQELEGTIQVPLILSSVLVLGITRPHCLQVQPQPAASSDLTDKTDKATLLYAKSGQHLHQCACFRLKGDF